MSIGFSGGRPLAHDVAPRFLASGRGCGYLRSIRIKKLSIGTRATPPENEPTRTGNRNPGVSQQSKTLQLFLSHRAALLTYAMRLTGNRTEAEDVLQEAWLRFGAAAEQPLEEPSGYLYRIVRNLAIDGRRRRGIENRVFQEDADSEAARMPSDAPSPEMRAISSDELRIALEALKEMPERMRIAVEMHRFGGAKLKDIAARLGISTTTAHGLVTEAIEICRARLRRPS